MQSIIKATKYYKCFITTTAGIKVNKLLDTKDITSLSTCFIKLTKSEIKPCYQHPIFYCIREIDLSEHESYE